MLTIYYSILPTDQLRTVNSLHKKTADRKLKETSPRPSSASGSTRRADHASSSEVQRRSYYETSRMKDEWRDHPDSRERNSQSTTDSRLQLSRDSWNYKKLCHFLKSYKNIILKCAEKTQKWEIKRTIRSSDSTKYS